LGSASLETNELGQVISYEEYHPFGTSAYRTAKSGTDLSLKRYRFTNKERDDETGLYYFGVRYYAAWLGRWTSSDPGDFVDGLNMYVYVRNNPVMLVDEEGYEGEPPPDDLVNRGQDNGVKPENAVVRGGTDNVDGGFVLLGNDEEDQITPRVSYDENNQPIITIVVTGKVIDYVYTKLDRARRVARIVNNVTSEIWIGSDTEVNTVSGVDVTGLGIIGRDGNALTGEVELNFEFNFEAVNSITDADPNDHIIALTEMRGAGWLMGTSGATNRVGGRVIWLQHTIFNGPWDYMSDSGAIVAAHEIITHAMGLSHQGAMGDITKGKGVWWSSDRLSKGLAETILRNLLGTWRAPSLNQGPNSEIQDGVQVPSFDLILPSTGRNVGADEIIYEESIIEKERVKQGIE
jgi:RHS repeat-associated protein